MLCGRSWLQTFSLGCTGLVPSPHPGVSLCPVPSPLQWDFSHVITLSYSPKQSLFHPWCDRSCSPRFFPVPFSDLCVCFISQFSAPSLEQCLSQSSIYVSIYNIGTSQTSSITAWSLPCDAYCIHFYSFSYIFNTL